MLIYTVFTVTHIILMIRNVQLVHSYMYTLGERIFRQTTSLAFSTRKSAEIARLKNYEIDETGNRAGELNTNACIRTRVHSGDRRREERNKIERRPRGVKCMLDDLNREGPLEVSLKSPRAPTRRELVNRPGCRSGELV